MHGDFPEDLSKERESSYKVRLYYVVFTQHRQRSERLSTECSRIRLVLRQLEGQELQSCWNNFKKGSVWGTLGQCPVPMLVTYQHTSSHR